MSANPYLTALEAMKTALETENKPLQSFNRVEYKPTFEKFYARMIPAFDAIETLYGQVGEPEEMLSNMAQALTDSAKEALDKCSRKGAKDALMMNFNMQLAIMIFPAVLHYKGQSSKPFADVIGRKWKEAFPKSNVQQAEYEYIEKGFHRRFCYITTAVCETLDKPDDCYELQLLRNYRDNYLMKRPGGEEMVKEYYDVAPSIVKHIDRCSDSEQIYQEVYLEWIAPCIDLIEKGKNEECRERYTRMVYTLKDRFFYAS